MKKLPVNPATGGARCGWICRSVIIVMGAIIVLVIYYNGYTPG